MVLAECYASVNNMCSKNSVPYLTKAESSKLSNVHLHYHTTNFTVYLCPNSAPIR